MFITKARGQYEKRNLRSITHSASNLD